MELLDNIFGIATQLLCLLALYGLIMAFLDWQRMKIIKKKLDKWD